MKTRRVDPKYYTEDYYLNDCVGYKEFKKYCGNKLEQRLEKLVKDIYDLNGKTFLDIGCGRGELVLWAAKKGAEKAIGIDYSKAAIKLANIAKNKQIKSIQKRIQFSVGDAKYINYKSNSIDLITITEVWEHLYPEEQNIILKILEKITKKDGLILIHTSPSKHFVDYFYRFWCFPVSKVLVTLNNFVYGKKYTNILHPKYIRNSAHKIMHVNEPTYFNLLNSARSTGFEYSIKSPNVTFSKPIISWKDTLFNLIVFFMPISNYFPFNVFFGQDYLLVLKKK